MTTMDVEVVDIRKINGDGSLRAFADVKIAGSLVVKGFSVMQGKNGIFVSMPKKASKDGRWFNILETTDEQLERALKDKVLEAYDRETNGAA